jgi:small subunit ribosomal protein S1
VENPREVIRPGTDVRVKVLEIDSERRRLSLSIKRVEDQVLPAVEPEDAEVAKSQLDDISSLSGGPFADLAGQMFNLTGVTEEAAAEGATEPAAEAAATETADSDASAAAVAEDQVAVADGDSSEATANAETAEATEAEATAEAAEEEKPAAEAKAQDEEKKSETGA